MYCFIHYFNFSCTFQNLCFLTSTWVRTSIRISIFTKVLFSLQYPYFYLSILKKNIARTECKYFATSDCTFTVPTVLYSGTSSAVWTIGSKIIIVSIMWPNSNSNLINAISKIPNTKNLSYELKWVYCQAGIFLSSFTTRFTKVVCLKRTCLLINQYYHVKGALLLHKHGTLFFCGMQYHQW